jgi:hypothetical protein
MKLQIDNRMYGMGDQKDNNRWLMVALLAVTLLCICHGRASAQIVSSNPLEYVALAEGNELPD